jgi:cytochrome c
MNIRTMTAAAVALLVATTLAFAAVPTTKEDAIAMVKKAVALIKAEGTEKAYAEINKGAPYVDRDVYTVVQGFDGVTLAHATNPKLIGKNMMEAQDVDGKYFAKEMATRGQKEASFWFDYKFANPATKKIQVKDMYCEAVPPTTVCAGVYRP